MFSSSGERNLETTLAQVKCFLCTDAGCRVGSIEAIVVSLDPVGMLGMAPKVTFLASIHMQLAQLLICIYGKRNSDQPVEIRIIATVCI